jgi:GxxExxY protein
MVALSRYDFSKIQLKGKEELKDLLFMANRILITLGVGYFHQVYRRAFYYELEMAKIDFEVIKEVRAIWHEQILETKEVGFFQIGNLLLSVVAVKELNQLILSIFSHYLRYLKCQRGLVFNFNAVHLEYRYLEQ